MTPPSPAVREDLETLDIGILVVEEATFELRLVRRVASFFVALGGSLDGPHLSEGAARARATECLPGLTWRGDLAPRDGEGPCPICAAPVALWPRHPKLVCSACVCAAVDGNGRALRFGNTGPLGTGFRAALPDGSEPREPHTCFVRGVRCFADEGRFGGVVVEVFDEGSARMRRG
jgi:hypothetical protein